MALGSSSMSIFALRQSTHDELSMDDEEIDQLDSGLDSEEEVDELEEAAPSASTSKARPKKTGERVPGHTLIPATRVANIVQGSEAGAHLSKEALYMLSVATEEFIKRLSRAGKRMADKEARQLVYYRDVASAAQKHHEFDFAQDVIPAPMSLAEALDRRAAREKELEDADPAIAPAVDPWTIPPPDGSPSSEAPPAASNAGTRIKRSRPSHTNGSAEPDGGSISAPIVSRPRIRDASGRWSINSDPKPERKPIAPSRRMPIGTRPGSSRIRERTSRASEGGQPASADSPSSANGTPSISRMSMGPPPPRASPSQASRAMPRAEDVRSGGGFAGSPNGFMDDHRLLNGGSRGSGIADAPGRTIYSAQRATQSNR